MGMFAANYLRPFKIVINDRVLIEAFKPDSIISPKVTLVIKKFTVTRPFSSLALLPTPLSLPHLLLTFPVVTCLVTNPFLPFCRYHPLFSYGLC